MAIWVMLGAALDKGFREKEKKKRKEKGKRKKKKEKTIIMKIIIIIIIKKTGLEMTGHPLTQSMAGLDQMGNDRKCWCASEKVQIAGGGRM